MKSSHFFRYDNNVIIVLVMSTLMGIISIILPPYIVPHGIKETCESPLFPFIGTAIENLAFIPTVVLLLVLGGILGFYFVKLWWLIGIFSILFLPIISIIEMVVSPTSHNLWPIEFMIYGMISIPAFFSAFIGSIVGKRLRS